MLACRLRTWRRGRHGDGCRTCLGGGRTRVAMRICAHSRLSACCRVPRAVPSNTPRHLVVAPGWGAPVVQFGGGQRALLHQLHVLARAALICTRAGMAALRCAPRVQAAEPSGMICATTPRRPFGRVNWSISVRAGCGSWQGSSFLRDVVGCPMCTHRVRLGGLQPPTMLASTVDAPAGVPLWSCPRGRPGRLTATRTSPPFTPRS